jgi:hypothetical protein
MLPGLGPEGSHQVPATVITCKSADALDHIKDSSVDVVVMDPPYYDNVMYAELSDYFYVWLKRTAGYVVPELFRQSLTDKDHEAVANLAKFKGQKNPKALAARSYQERMGGIFAECRRLLKANGIMTLMFTHKAIRFCAGSRLRANRILRALRDIANVPRRQLETTDRKAAIALVRANTPVRRLVSRHTRELLRKYYKARKITTPIADRQVRDEFIRMTPEERTLYEQVEDYISNTYNRASDKERTAVGFVMTIYRRRLASSFWALEETLNGHLEAIKKGDDEKVGRGLDDDVFDSEVDDELLDTDEAAALEHEALTFEERSAVEDLIRRIQALPPDSKLEKLRIVLEELRNAGYDRAMVFTQYTDTMDFLRNQLSRNSTRCLHPWAQQPHSFLFADDPDRIVALGCK